MGVSSTWGIMSIFDWNWHPIFVIVIFSSCDFVSFFCVFFLVMLAHDEPIMKSKVFINLVVETLIGNFPKLTTFPYLVNCFIYKLWIMPCYVVTKKKGKVKRIKHDAYETSKQSQKHYNSITNYITWFVTYCQSEILLKSINSNKTKLCISRFANQSQLCESLSYISLMAIYCWLLSTNPYH